MTEKTDDKIRKSEEEWRKQLTDHQFKVTRKHGTERAFSGIYWDHHDQGTYNCICCGQPLFSSEHKFDSGTGWPSYWQPDTPDAVETQEDSSFFMQADRGPLRALQRPSRARVRRRPRADRAALLHQFGVP